ncbi:MAG: transposase [SAR324 cluster bacterium]|nr:transposase [SAR324 cluster bacterium]
MRETISICPKCHCIYHSEELAKLVAPGSNFGYDVLVHVGKALFLRHRNNREVAAELAQKNVQISTGEIAYLGKKFVTYLAIAHQQCADRIKQAMQLKGGYIFHLDGTCEGQSPLLMSGLDSLSEIVLGNVKLPSEKADKIIPFLKDIKEKFGVPLALVHDMGKAILNAVAKVFPKTPDFICHFHFLRDIGKDLFGDEYDIIRQRLRKHGITTKLRSRAKQLKQAIDKNPDAIDSFHHGLKNNGLPQSSVELIPTITVYSLILWALEGKNQGQGYGFPFDRPHLAFAGRLQEIYCHIDQLKNIRLRQSWKDNRSYFKIMGDMKKIMTDKILWKAVNEIESKIDVFDKLRDAMRIAPTRGNRGLNHDGMESTIGRIEQGVRKFRLWLTSRKEYSTNQGYRKMIEQIDKYWKKLFADPITVDGPDGKIRIQPQRTNNIMEQYFRDFKRGNRRKTGNNSSSRMLQNMLAQTPLVRNLKKPEYMKILLDGKTTLEEVFVEIEITRLREDLKNAQQNPEKIPAKIKNLIKEHQYPEKLANLVKKSELKPKSNRILR